MDFKAVFSQVLAFLPHNRLPLLLGSAGLLLFVLGLIWSFNPFSQGSGVEFIASETQAEASASAKMVVDVSGAVEKPGVYSLSGDIRLQDVLVAAGGLSAIADREWVSKSLNLAAKISDGAKIYIPTVDERVQGSTDYSLPSTVNQGSAVVGSQSTTSGLININTASSSELDKLPGVGPVTSQKIIDNRPYSSIDELLSKKVVGKKVFEQIKEKVTTF